MALRNIVAKTGRTFVIKCRECGRQESSSSKTQGYMQAFKDAGWKRFTFGWKCPRCRKRMTLQSSVFTYSIT